MSVISRYKLFRKSVFSYITSGRVHLDVRWIDQVYQPTYPVDCSKRRSPVRHRSRWTRPPVKSVETEQLVTANHSAPGGLSQDFYEVQKTTLLSWQTLKLSHIQGTCTHTHGLCQCHHLALIWSSYPHLFGSGSWCSNSRKPCLDCQVLVKEKKD